MHPRMFLRSIVASGSLLFMTACAKSLVAFQTQRQSTKHKPSSTRCPSDLLSPDDEWVVKWVEDASAPPLTMSPSLFADQDEDPFAHWYDKPERKIIWMGRMEDNSYDPSFVRRQSSSAVSKVSPHPLRMEQWNMTLSWREQRRRRHRALSFEFHENGYVRTVHPTKHSKPSSSNKQQIAISNWRDRIRQTIIGHSLQQQNSKPQYIVGTWKLAPAGVTWKMTWDGKTYLFFADLHSNPFGKHPKMFRGLVLRDRTTMMRRFLRPLVATFTGKGVGADTADFSYQNRGP